MSARKRTIAAAALLIAGTFACFLGAVHNEYISLDDRMYVLENPAVMGGLTWSGIVQIFSTVTFSYWQPLAYFSHMVDVQLFGVNASAHHMVSVAWHCANAALLFVALFRLTGAMYRSLFAAAFFALHPMHVEPVAWIASRKDLLSAFFFICGLLAYAWYCKHGTARRYLCVCLAFALGLMAKPNILAFPLVLMLLDFWPLQRKVKANIIEKIPLFLLSAVSLLATMGTIDPTGRLSTEFLSSSPSQTPGVIKALIIAAQYLPKFFWPTHLSITMSPVT
jgi:hypothetical protein